MRKTLPQLLCCADGIQWPWPCGQEKLQSQHRPKTPKLHLAQQNQVSNIKQSIFDLCSKTEFQHPLWIYSGLFFIYTTGILSIFLMQARWLLSSKGMIIHCNITSSHKMWHRNLFYTRLWTLILAKSMWNERTSVSNLLCFPQSKHALIHIIIYLDVKWCCSNFTEEFKPWTI